ncbi:MULTISPECIES: FCD domain-containing protein [Paenibacillus]|uniref:FCD domain-containing protein n=1 Tax=Paenibacillus TaxID=44249 RepID=UPI001F2691B6|nr:FCD domain-containing protein [Paenibacillus sp. JJ-223]CAH1210318.1 HTH-type transcriptional repressor NanR [Paenibacillus sp. JJ-223]
MAPELYELELEYELLKQLRDAIAPVGASTLVHTLGKRYGLSQATIGRRLMEMDVEGYTVLEGRKGRVLTEAGLERLKTTERELQQKNVNSRLIQTLNHSGEKALLDILVARRALEREIASLAAERATKEYIHLLEQSIEAQNRQLAQNVIPYEEDREFHRLLAYAAQNQFLLHAVELVWDTSRDFLETAYIRRTVGSELVVDHRQILDAIISRSPEDAEAAMVNHINQMIEDVKRYFSMKNQSLSIEKAR